MLVFDLILLDGDGSFFFINSSEYFIEAFRLSFEASHCSSTENALFFCSWIFFVSHLIQYFLMDGKQANMAVPMSETVVSRARTKNQHHSNRNILSLIMFKLRTHMAWSTFRLPVKAPEGN